MPNPVKRNAICGFQKIIISIFHEFDTFWKPGHLLCEESPTEKWVDRSPGLMMSRAGMTDPENRGSFPHDRVTPPALLGLPPINVH